MNCYIKGIGVWSPWFNDWDAFCATVQAGQTLVDASEATPRPELIPRNERRRAPLSVRLAVEVSCRALRQSALPASEVACIFAYGQGDAGITDYMCRRLATAEQQVSPTKFHNSVHNAASGYWTISSGCMQAANSISAFDKTVPLSLLEAACQLASEQRPILLTMYDCPAPETLRYPLFIRHPFAAALLLVQEEQAGAADPLLQLEASSSACSEWPELAIAGLEELYTSNPAARILPVLAALARREAGEFRGAMPTGAAASMHYSVREQA